MRLGEVSRRRQDLRAMRDQHDELLDAVVVLIRRPCECSSRALQDKVPECDRCVALGAIVRVMKGRGRE